MLVLSERVIAVTVNLRDVRRDSKIERPAWPEPPTIAIFLRTDIETVQVSVGDVMVVQSLVTKSRYSEELKFGLTDSVYTFYFLLDNIAQGVFPRLDESICILAI